MLYREMTDNKGATQMKNEKDSDSLDPKAEIRYPDASAFTDKDRAAVAINEYMGPITPEIMATSGLAYVPRQASEIGQSMLRAALRRRLPGEECVTEKDVVRVLSGRAPQGATPCRRFSVNIFVGSAALDLLVNAAEKCGLNVEAFVLDAAVCRAQDIRAECARKREPFSERTDAEDVRARSRARANLKLVE